MSSSSAESDTTRSRRFGRSTSGNRRFSVRSNSNSPFHSGKILTVLRQKFSARVSRSRESYDASSSSCHHHSDGRSTSSSNSATLCSSWRSRPRHVDKPIRPAYSDESLNCCGRRPCLRGRGHPPPRSPVGHELSVFNADSQQQQQRHQQHPQPSTSTIRGTSKRARAGIVICKYCHSKNDNSPSDFELSEHEISQTDDGKVFLLWFKH